MSEAMLPLSLPAPGLPKEHWAQQQKAPFSWHQLPTVSVQREKSAYEGRICICASVNTQDLCQRPTREKTRTLEQFPPTKTFPYYTNLI